MARVYLETSFFSACVSHRTSAKAITWRETSNVWWRVESAQHDLFISDEVVYELSAPTFVNGPAALRMLDGIQVLDLDEDTRGLAAILVREKLMPEPSARGDAVHIAAATRHRMDYVMTWNVKHLANPNKREHLAVVCLRVGFVPPQIITPDLLMEGNQ